MIEPTRSALIYEMIEIWGIFIILILHLEMSAISIPRLIDSRLTRYRKSGSKGSILIFATLIFAIALYALFLWITRSLHPYIGILGVILLMATVMAPPQSKAPTAIIPYGEQHGSLLSPHESLILHLYLPLTWLFITGPLVTCSLMTLFYLTYHMHSEREVKLIRALILLPLLLILNIYTYVKYRFASKTSSEPSPKAPEEVDQQQIMVFSYFMAPKITKKSSKQHFFITLANPFITYTITKTVITLSQNLL